MNKLSTFLQGISFIILFIILLISINIAQKITKLNYNCQQPIIIYKSENYRNLALCTYIIEHSGYKIGKNYANQLIDTISLVINKLKIQNKIPNLIKIFPNKQKLLMFILAIIEQESIFQQYVKSDVGAIGLMQIYPSNTNLKYLKVNKEELYNIETNIKCGVLLLEHHINIAINNFNKNKIKYDTKQLLVKSLNIYSNDNSGKYAIDILYKFSNICRFFEIF